MMAKKNGAPKAVTTNLSTRWFSRLMLFAPVLAIIAGYVAFWDSLFFPDRVM